MTKEEILKRHPIFSRSDFGLPGGTPIFMELNHVISAMSSWSAIENAELRKRVDELEGDFELIKSKDARISELEDAIKSRNIIQEEDKQEIEALKKEKKNWQKRCEAAEKIIEISGVVDCDGYEKWQLLKSQTPK